MPITLNVPEWGEVQVLTLRETAKRMGVSVDDVQWWVDNELLESYMQSTVDKAGKIKKQTIYIDLIDLADLEKFERKFPEGAPWERILWARYELIQHRRERPDPRTTERTMVQPQRPQRPQPPQPKKPQKLPTELRNAELYDELEARQPSHPPRAQPIRQTVPPAGCQPQRRQDIVEEDYYAEPDAPTERDTGDRRPKQQQPRKRGMRLW